jgi:hyperosmotically inducible periplasmic protein
MSDHILEQAVMQTLASNAYVPVDQIAVEVIDGRAILRGTVATLFERGEAVHTARNVRGITTVDDELLVKLMGASGRADADTEAAVLAAFIADDEVHSDDLEVKARDGVVTLTGLVELPRQRDRAERIARDVGGVRKVYNRVAVWLTVSADDVAERITDAIGDDALLGIDNVSVAVDANDVTLSGVVTSRAHHDAAVEAAAGAPGVVRVHDSLQVRPRERR